jgi:hypothetical protein
LKKKEKKEKKEEKEEKEKKRKIVSQIRLLLRETLCPPLATPYT